MLYAAGFALRALGQLKESTQLMQAVLDAYISQQKWKSAAIAASNLSDTYLNIGELAQALDDARQSVKFADLSGEGFQQFSKRSTLANTFHQVGRLAQAEETFRQAERLLKKKRQAEHEQMLQQRRQAKWMRYKRPPRSPILSSLQGFQYCDLLLNQGKYQEAMIRAKRILATVTQHGQFLNIALAYLSMGRAYLIKAKRENTGNFAQATDYLKRAVDGLRQAGTLHLLPSGLLGRAELYRNTGEFERARADLDEAMRIATRGSMGLHEADCHLEYARLYLAQGKNEQARASWAKAKEMIERMGYHRRDRDVREIDEQLRAAGV